MDDFISVAIPTSREQLDHVANATMRGIHEVFPAEDDPASDPLAKKKLDKGDGAWSPQKEVLGFDFDGRPGHHTIALPADK